MPTTPDTLKITRSLDVSNSLARRQLLSFCYSACRLDGECLGWLPKAAYDQAHQQGRIIALYNNDDLVGFVLWSAHAAECRILQIWIRRDARLMLHGRALIEAVEAIARSKAAHILRLWCAVDLAANLFWRALGFHYRTWRWGRAQRGRRHALWVRTVTTSPVASRARSNDEPPAALAPANPPRILLPEPPGARTR